jgi:hypothetical protein
LTVSIVEAVFDTTPLPPDRKEEFKKALYMLKQDASLELAIAIKGKQGQLTQPGVNPGAVAAQGMVNGTQERAGLPPPSANAAPQQVTQGQPSEDATKQGTTQQ